MASIRTSLCEHQVRDAARIEAHPLFPHFSIIPVQDQWKRDTYWHHVYLFDVYLGRYHDSVGGQAAALWYCVRTWVDNHNRAAWVSLAHWSRAADQEPELDRLLAKIDLHFGPNA
jgi:hypothetical protein